METQSNVIQSTTTTITTTLKLKTNITFPHQDTDQQQQQQQLTTMSQVQSPSKLNTINSVHPSTISTISSSSSSHPPVPSIIKSRSRPTTMESISFSSAIQQQQHLKPINPRTPLRANSVNSSPTHPSPLIIPDQLTATHTLPKRTSSIVRRHTLILSETQITDQSQSNIPSTPPPQITNVPPNEAVRRRTVSRNMGANKIDKNHEKYAFMYHMLTGIRLSVSRCETKEDRDLLPDDFKAQHKLTSDVTGAELESSQRYDFKFKDYCPMVFRKIRAAFGLTAPDYLNSLTGKYILSELFSPGKSKSYLYYSHDYRYIIKTIHKAEQNRLLKILPQYVEYVIKNPNTLLARYYGLHRVKMPKLEAVHIVVMANVFPPNYDIHLTFDLKGSTLGREITPEELQRKGKKAVLKDLNWVKMNRKLMLGPEKAKLFCDQLELDMLFLMAKNIMDYSLLIGIHDLSLGNNTDDLQQQQVLMSTPVPNSSPATDMPNTQLQVFELNKFTLQRKGPPADTVRKALQQPEITRLDTISALHLEPQNRSMRSVFFEDMGGFRATDENNLPLNELYFMSVIDILTPYNASKKIEHAFKVVTRPKDRMFISAVKPQDYGRRFVGFMKALVGTVSIPTPMMALPPPSGSTSSSSGRHIEPIGDET